MTAASAHSPPTSGTRPSAWIERFAPLVANGARVLDVACGQGRHARFFAGRGHPVLAVDRDAAALATLADDARIRTATLDLEDGTWPLPGERFGAIVVTNYLHRPLFPFLLAALEGDGVLLYETFADGNEAYGRPRNPEFLLRQDELWQVAQKHLTVIAFEQGQVSSPSSASVVTSPPSASVLQRLAAVGRDRRWPPPLPPG